MEEIVEILQKITPEADFYKSTDFFQDGLLDSLQSMMLIMSIEEVFQIKIKGSDILPENICNLQALERLVNRYK